MEQSDAIATAQAQLDTTNQNLTSLQAVEKNLKDPTIAGDIQRYASSFREDDILENIFSNTSGVSIQNISMDKGQKTPNGLSLANINLSLMVTSKDQLISFLDYLTSPTNTKRYIIQSVNYPYDPVTPG